MKTLSLPSVAPEPVGRFGQHFQIQSSPDMPEDTPPPADPDALAAFLMGIRDKLIGRGKKQFSSIPLDEIEETFSRVMARIVEDPPLELNDAFVYTALSRKLLDHLKHQKVEEKSAADLQSLTKVTKTPAEISMRNELREAVSRLPLREKQLIEGHYFKGFSVDEVGQAIGLKHAQAYFLTNRAIEKLRLWLSE